jgi:hypothetical protein
MKNRTKKRICECIIILNMLLTLGYAGSCEKGFINGKEFILKIIIILLCTIIPLLKIGAFEK